MGRAVGRSERWSLRTLGEAAMVVLATSALALTVNALRRDGLPLVATSPYATLVPCPEPGGPVLGVSPEDMGRDSSRDFLVDARAEQDYLAWHLPGAENVPYDWLDPLPDARLRELARVIAASGASRVVVYGDGGRPDSGEHLGREISGGGIRNVCFVVGGVPALRPGSGP